MSREMTDAEKRAQTAVVVDRFVTEGEPGAYARIQVGSDPLDPNLGGGYVNISVGESAQDAPQTRSGERRAFRSNIPVNNKPAVELNLTDDE